MSGNPHTVLARTANTVPLVLLLLSLMCFFFSFFFLAKKLAGNPLAWAELMICHTVQNLSSFVFNLLYIHHVPYDLLLQ